MSETNKNVFLKSAWICILLYMVLFWSSGLVIMSPWPGFLFCVVLSIGSFILSIISIIKETRRGLSFLTALFAILLILFTIFIYLLPEAGIPPEIPLFYP
ncbi:MAG: hypothetical protein ABS889_06635 [Desemzia incerta]